MVSTRRECESLDEIAMGGSVDSTEFERWTLIEYYAVVVPACSSSVWPSRLNRDSIDDLGVSRYLTD